MKVTALIKTLHRGARTGIAGFALSAAVLGYPGAENRQPATASLALVSTTVPLATWAAGSASTLQVCTVAFSFTTVAALVPAAMPSLAGAAVFSPLFAQATFDSAVQQFLGLISKVLILLGIAVVCYGGWMVSQGKTSDGITALIGGFLMVSAVLVVRLLATYIGSPF